MGCKFKTSLTLQHDSRSRPKPQRWANCMQPRVLQNNFLVGFLKTTAPIPNKFCSVTKSKCSSWIAHWGDICHLRLPCHRCRLAVCPIAYLRDQTGHGRTSLNFASPWLGLSLVALRYVMYFRFCGWRRVPWPWEMLDFTARRYCNARVCCVYIRVADLACCRAV